MLHNRSLLKLYYRIKPLIPRGLQILVRRRMVACTRKTCSDIWPIDSAADRQPEHWHGWPEGKRFALVLTHDVDTAKGQEGCPRLLEIERQRGFRSSFNFVPKRYDVSPELRHQLMEAGFEVGVHGLYHDGKYYESRELFNERAVQINRYLRNWEAVGFRSPSMLHNLEWIRDLDIEYDSSTFDTDPFEPQSDGVKTIFPLYLEDTADRHGYVELPYTLPQDFTLFILMQEETIDIWRKKLDWIHEKGGMALINTHPDYMNFTGAKLGREEYPAHFYAQFLDYAATKYGEHYWHALPRDVARFFKAARESRNNA